MKVRILLKSGATVPYHNVSRVHMAQGVVMIKHGSLTTPVHEEDIETMIVEDEED